MSSGHVTRVLGPALVALMVVAGSGCGPSASPSSSPAGAPIPVLGAENFYADLLAQIGGPRVTASSILNDPRAHPHEYEASPGAGRLVPHSNGVHRHGHGYDHLIEKVLPTFTP